jgi:hypothetical protein
MQRKGKRKEELQTPTELTLIYLENYRELQRYVKEAVSEPDQIAADRYNISAERAYLRSIRECRAETVILLEHIDKAMQSLKEDVEASGEGYKYDVLEAVYIQGKTYAEVARDTGCGKNSPKKWCRAMIPKLTIKLFGAKALDNGANCAEIEDNLSKTG